MHEVVGLRLREGFGVWVEGDGWEAECCGDWEWDGWGWVREGRGIVIRGGPIAILNDDDDAEAVGYEEEDVKVEAAVI